MYHDKKEKRECFGCVENLCGYGCLEKGYILAEVAVTLASGDTEAVPPTTFLNI
jgi:hypothetical protein